MASRCLNSPHLSSFLSSDAIEEIGSSSSFSSSSALVYSPVKVRVPLMKKAADKWEEHQIEEHQDTAALSTQLQLPATASKMYTSEYSFAAADADAAAIAVQFKLYEESSEEASSSSASSSSSSSVIESRTTIKASSSFLSSAAAVAAPSPNQSEELSMSQAFHKIYYISYIKINTVEYLQKQLCHLL